MMCMCKIENILVLLFENLSITMDVLADLLSIRDLNPGHKLNFSRAFMFN